MSIRPRRTFYFRAQCCGDPCGRATREIKPPSGDFTRITLATARLWAKLPVTNSNERWLRDTGRSVLVAERCSRV